MKRMMTAPASTRGSGFQDGRLKQMKKNHWLVAPFQTPRITTRIRLQELSLGDTRHVFEHRAEGDEPHGVTHQLGYGNS